MKAIFFREDKISEDILPAKISYLSFCDSDKSWFNFIENIKIELDKEIYGMDNVKNEIIN